MPTRKEITDAVDTRVSELLPWIAEQQEAYAKGGKYAQLDWSHSSDPQDGKVRQPDKLSHKLPGKEKTWTDFGYPIDEPVANAAIDEYEMPDGRRGWVLKLRTKVGKDTFEKTIDSGDGGFGHDWQAVNREVAV